MNRIDFSTNPKSIISTKNTNIIKLIVDMPENYESKGTATV
ncbi:MAG: hypothetical protein PHU24_09370 [Sphaerochaetaceae bacterium]|nr:hypothetical protein [Sphaerochaetaceae bacterium]MDD3671804.1 hypothetical protein [Sphaerochaetaceae bacterium]MDD4842468.1 hypothetical protein [Sphaerochaetaceae bacterium]